MTKETNNNMYKILIYNVYYVTGRVLHIIYVQQYGDCMY